MLKTQIGSIWIGNKVAERINEAEQASNRRGLFVRLALDKVNLYTNLNTVKSLFTRVFYATMVLYNFFLRYSNLHDF